MRQKISYSDSLRSCSPKQLKIVFLQRQIKEVSTLSVYLLINRVAPDTDLAGYPANIFAGYPAWPDLKCEAKHWI